MKDINGIELKVGMDVVYRVHGVLRKGTIVKVNPKTVRVTDESAKGHEHNIMSNSLVVPYDNRVSQEFEDLKDFVNNKLDGVIKNMKEDA